MLRNQRNFEVIRGKSQLEKEGTFSKRNSESGSQNRNLIDQLWPNEIRPEIRARLKSLRNSFRIEIQNVQPKFPLSRSRRTFAPKMEVKTKPAEAGLKFEGELGLGELLASRARRGEVETFFETL